MFDNVRRALILWKFKGAIQKGLKMGIFKSKKFWAALVGAVVVSIAKQLGIDDATAAKIAAMIVAYIIGQGIADAGKHAPVK
jgi:uncharacterized membrane protein YvlD (DUF360 family)